MVHLSALVSRFRNQITKADIGASGSPLDVVGQLTLPVISIGNFRYVFTIVNTLTVDCLLGADYLVAHEAVIDNKHCIVMIKRCGYHHSRIIFPFQTVNIPNHTVQLTDVTLPEDAMSMNLSTVLIESQTSAKPPKHTLLARTFSPVSEGT